MFHRARMRCLNSTSAVVRGPSEEEGKEGNCAERGVRSFARFWRWALGSSPGWWAATVATYCPSRIVEHIKSKSTQPRYSITRVTLYLVNDLWSMILSPYEIKVSKIIISMFQIVADMRGSSGENSTEPGRNRRGETRRQPDRNHRHRQWPQLRQTSRAHPGRHWRGQK